MQGVSILLWVPTVWTCDTAVAFYINSAATEHMLLYDTLKTKVKLEKAMKYNTDTV